MVRIAIYGIAKNEHSFVERFMDSCIGADVVVIGVDPGDTTADLLKARGAHIVEISLPKFRFDDYRNQVLKSIPSNIDICISLDLDEVLPDDWRKIVENDWRSNTTRLNYHLQWSDDNKFSYDRIHARYGYTWKHANHEGVYCIDSDNEISSDSSLVVTHLPDSEKDRSKNLPLLEFACQEEPNDTRMNWYLMREYYYEGEYNKCIDQAKIYIGLIPKWKEEYCWACIIVARCYRYLGDTLNSFAWLHWSIRICPTLRDGYHELSIFHYDLDEYKKALDEVNNALNISSDNCHFFQSNGSYNHNIYFLKARILSELKSDLAPYYFRKVLRIKPDHEESIQMLDQLI